MNIRHVARIRSVIVRGVAILAVFAVPISIASAESKAKPKPAVSGVFPDEKISVNGETRHFRLIVPKSVDLKKPAPIVFAYHGMLIDSKDVMPKYTKLGELAEDNRFLLVFPAAIDRHWGIAPRKVKADVAFFDALRKEIQKRYRIDESRIYVLGMSNGGYFAHLLGKERSKVIAAVCSHSGPLGLQTLFGIRAERKFPVMIVHGSEDSIFPVQFARENRDKYTREGHRVKYVEVPKLNHVWATKSNINKAIWKFFELHSLSN
jgi:polyhydroxybutyrate depolymerase